MENINITKKDDNTIEVVKVMPVAFTFTPEYLKTQREAILKQKAEQIAQRDIEIAEIDGYLAEMEKLGVCEKVIEDVKEVSEEIVAEVIKE
jgi:hypothetical protein